MRQSISLDRFGEIASAVAFLASPRSDDTTGAILRIDGRAANSR
jgi:NAD(P)-dependent dehydrogenase (short-subunit alcohol dehydrogenase family)